MKLNRDFWSHPLTNHALQFVFIFSSVYFAFWLTRVNETSKLRQVEEKAISAIYLELSANLDRLEQSYPYHDTLLTDLSLLIDDLDQESPIAGLSLHQVLQKIITRNSNALGYTFLQESAWNTFQNTEAYVLLDYDMASSLSEHYQLQKEGVQTTVNLLQGLFLSDELYQPEIMPYEIRQFFFVFRELVGQESYLIDHTRQTLELLKEEYPELVGD